MQSATPTNKLHPLIATAAIAVTAVSVLGAVVLVTNQVSAQHAAAPAAAIAAALPSAPAESAAPAAAAVPATTPRATIPARSTTAATNHPRAPISASSAPSHAVESAPQVAQAPVAAPYPMPAAATERPVPTIAQSPVCVDCGTVTSVREVKTAGEGTGIGVIAGGVLGGVLGNQMGRGNGKDATRILGAIGGAVAGHQIEKQARATTRYEVTVRMEDGSLRTLTRSSDPGVKAGDRIRVDGDQIRSADGALIAPRPAPRVTSERGDA